MVKCPNCKKKLHACSLSIPETIRENKAIKQDQENDTYFLIAVKRMS